VNSLPAVLNPGAGKERTVLLVVPPFSGVDRPSLALHLLQACAREAGFAVDVFYANLYLANRLGHRLYETISYAPTFWLLGERFFAGAAYKKPALTRDSLAKLRNRKDVEFEIDSDLLLDFAGQASAFADKIAARIAEARYPIVGFSTTFEQTAASIALINRVKAIDAGVITIIGGANCEGPMAQGVLSLSSDIDYVFSGESEASFRLFLENWQANKLSSQRIIEAEAGVPLEQLPLPDYQEFYSQLHTFLPAVAEAGDLWLPYESSRGCWWGAKHHCTFCGLNAQTMAHRTKPGGKVLEDLCALLARHPSRKVSMVDNIMPHEYFKTFLPHVKEALGDIHIFYEEKANLSLEQVLLLKEAGVHVIQPGIESLSSRVLKLIDKGVTARKNIELLRFARAADLSLNWNYLIGFPGDLAENYWEVVNLIPALVHLTPPSGLSGLSIDRFSPYFERPSDFGVREIRPMASYVDVLPESADVFAVAYHFHAEYDSESRRDTAVQDALRTAIGAWRALWSQDEAAPPALSVCPVDDEMYLLVDSRFNRSEPAIEFIDAARMRLVLTGESDGNPEWLVWARERQYLVKLDGRWTPLATADPGTLLKAISGPRSTAAAGAPFVLMA
jgi:ribosomal peptide maturation radical SAM protein 1